MHQISFPLEKNPVLRKKPQRSFQQALSLRLKLFLTVRTQVLPARESQLDLENWCSLGFCVSQERSERSGHAVSFHKAEDAWDALQHSEAEQIVLGAVGPFFLQGGKCNLVIYIWAQKSGTLSSSRDCSVSGSILLSKLLNPLHFRFLPCQYRYE